MGRARLGAAALASVIAATLVCGCASPSPGGPAAPTSAGRVSPGTAVPSSAAAVQEETWSDLRASAGSELIRSRAAAAVAGDVRTWLARVQGRNLRTAQEKVFARMQAIRVEQMRLRSIEETRPPVPATHGTSATWESRATLEYRIAGFDEFPRSFTLALTFAADPARPAETAVITGSRPDDRPEPWDLNGLQARSSDHSLVLAFGADSAAAADEVTRRADAAARRVSAVLGAAEAAVWIVPATDADAARLLGRDEGELDGVAAATDGPIGPDQPAGADRIVVVPGAWSALTGVGRDVIVAHELTHATARRTSKRQPPLWLAEGFAEYVAYRDVELPERHLVRSALDRITSTGLPAGPPGAPEFHSSSGDLTVAYGLSLTLARTIADQYGTDALVALFRAVNESEPGPALPADGDRLTDQVLRSRLGTSMAEVVAAWQSRLSALVAQPG
ncbi:MAG TPA: hypothetical protein VJN29_00345 [Intrasporangium sp.]|uniref:hypothetical protein n=1 Tax=Intrasporangium sp. TaxID=1925024 RepID=UPI002B45A9D5|nr:hypothetical protein [Intrasporangium sp.]HKX65646.1 hypothetical protein [Intrasporangium sp.]